LTPKNVVDIGSLWPKTTNFSWACCDVSTHDGGAENDGHENDEPSKLQGMKLQDMKMQDMKLQDMKLQDMTNISVFCTNPSNFSSIVENLM